MTVAELVPTSDTSKEAVGAFIGVIESISAQVPERVETDDQLAIAQTNMKAVRSLRKTINDKRLSLTRPLDQVKKQIKADFDIPIGQLDKIDAAFMSVVKPYLRKKEEEARQAQIERQRLEREERERRIAEQREAERKAREKEEQDSILARAEAKRIREEAQRKVEEAPAIEETLPAVPSAPKVDRRMFQKRYRAEVVDESALPSEFFVVDQKKLDALARANKGQNPPTGVVFVEID